MKVALQIEATDDGVRVLSSGPIKDRHTVRYLLGVLAEARLELEAKLAELGPGSGLVTAPANTTVNGQKIA